MKLLTYIKIVCLGLFVAHTTNIASGKALKVNPICEKLCIKSVCAGHQDVTNYCGLRCGDMAKNCQAAEDTSPSEQKIDSSFPCEVCTAGARRTDGNLRKACARNACTVAKPFLR
jgi:hypothetical protein